MDFAFFNAILRTETIPPEDPWLAGEPIHYYYFGYLLFANLARLSSIAPEVAYNLSMATIGAVLFAGAVSIGHATSGRRGLALVGGLGAALLGNLDGAIQVVIEGRSWFAIDYWRSSRVVEHTINDFPFFSILHGDLHPHVISIVILVPLAALLLSAARGEELEPRALDPVPLAVAAVLIAAVALTNPWDVPLAFALLGLLAIWRRGDPAAPVSSALSIALPVTIVLGFVFLATLPFRLHFDAPLSGIGRVHAQTSLRDAFVLFGPFAIPALALVGRLGADLLPETRELRHLFLALLGFAVAVIATAARSPVLALSTFVAAATLSLLLDRERNRVLGPVAALLCLGAAAIGVCEVVYLRDPYGQDLHRMNTVFKLYYQAWIYLALAWPAVLAGLADAMPSAWQRRVAGGLLGVAIAAALCYPAAAIATFHEQAPRPLVLDGMRYLERQHPDDARVIDWLRRHAAPGARLLEATDQPYSYFARFASNTGIPTLLGWANHERLWRGSDPVVGEREQTIRDIYGTTDAATAHRELSRHGVHYVVVGPLERRTYSGPGLDKFSSRDDLFPVVFRSGETTLFAVAGAASGRPRGIR